MRTLVVALLASLSLPAAAAPSFPLTLDGNWTDVFGNTGAMSATFEANGDYIGTYEFFGSTLTTVGSWSVNSGTIMTIDSDGNTITAAWTGNCLDGVGTFNGISVDVEACRPTQPSFFPLVTSGEWCVLGACDDAELTFFADGTYTGTASSGALDAPLSGQWTRLPGNQIVGSDIAGGGFDTQWDGTCLEGTATLLGLVVDLDVCP